MKNLLKILAVAVTSIAVLGSCRTGDDGTRNHGKATEGMFKKKELQDTLNDRDDRQDMIDDEPAI